MNIIELYIDGKLCDTGKNFGVRLNRQLLNPSELNTKDAQYSYSITLPFTAVNNAAFRYSNIEETKDKFNRLYDAELYINSVQVFKGVFKLSNINTEYKGNLYIPAAKSIKDIFGDIKLADNPEYRIEFKDFAEYITRYNTEAANGPQMAIFPYTLYGVLPKVPLTLNSNNYSARNIWDASVRMGIQDLAPSINPLLMLRHIFDGRKRNSDGSYVGDKPRYKLGGTAFDDERLTRLYMSYKNESDYVQPWNYGYLAHMKLSGSWSNYTSPSVFERGVYENMREASVAIIHGRKASDFFTVNLFNTTQADINVTEDRGGNVKKTQVEDDDGNLWNDYLITVPASGWYKIRIKGNFNLRNLPYFYRRDAKTGIRFVGDDSDLTNNLLRYKRYELKLLRDFGTGDFGLTNVVIDGTYYRDNIPQNMFDTKNYPNYFPQMKTPADGTNRLSQILMVDPAQNPNLICGLSWGGFETKDYNPRGDSVDSDWAKVLVAKSGLSWDVNANGSKPPKVVVNSPGYWKYGIIGDFANADDQYITQFEDAHIKYNVYFDENGILQANPHPDLYTTKVVSRYELQANRTCVLGIPDAALWMGSIRIYDTADESIAAVETLNSSDFWTGTGYEFIIETTDTRRYISFELAHTPIAGSGFVFNITSSVRLLYLTEDEDVLGWELSNKYRMVLNNAPLSYARRGWYKGAYSGDTSRKGDGEVQVIAWLDAGEALTLAAVSDMGGIRENNIFGAKREGWPVHDIDFELDISPFRNDEDWAKINSAGSSTAAMNWNDTENFDKDSIDLVKFLPADVKTDDFIDNFCKAFNLMLRQTDTDAFSLDVKQTKAAVSPLYVSLDGLASVKDRENSPLGLPSLYKIGFTIDLEEEGYIMTGDDGGGSFETGAVEENIIEQKSNFSYNWFKDINYTIGGANIVLPLPVISKSEVWADTMTYPDAMTKRYTSLAARFWYFDGLLNALGADFQFNNTPLAIAKVSNIIEGLVTLNYKNQINTILNIYFTVLVNSSSDYTEIEGYLTPEQYEKLDGSIMAMFNGDQYYVAELSGYDPLGKNKTKIKLIRKI